MGPTATMVISTLINKLLTHAIVLQNKSTLHEWTISCNNSINYVWTETMLQENTIALSRIPAAEKLRYWKRYDNRTMIDGDKMPNSTTTSGTIVATPSHRETLFVSRTNTNPRRQGLLEQSFMSQTAWCNSEQSNHKGSTPEHGGIWSEWKGAQTPSKLHTPAHGSNDSNKK